MFVNANNTIEIIRAFLLPTGKSGRTINEKFSRGGWGLGRNFQKFLPFPNLKSHPTSSQPQPVVMLALESTRQRAD